MKAEELIKVVENISKENSAYEFEVLGDNLKVQRIAEDDGEVVSSKVFEVSKISGIKVEYGVVKVTVEVSGSYGELMV